VVASDLNGGLISVLLNCGAEGVLGVRPVERATAGVLQLSAPWPSPTFGRSRVRFALSVPHEVDLGVFDLAGRHVRTLVHGTWAAGEHTLDWDGRDDGGAPLRHGVYVLRARAGFDVATRKLVILK
jgi:hypothetical protein